MTFHPKILLAGSRGRLIEKIKDDNITWCMFLACWIKNAADIHSEYVIRIAFTRQKWLRGGAPVLRYTYITCLVFPLGSFSYCVVICYWTYWTSVY